MFKQSIVKPPEYRQMSKNPNFLSWAINLLLILT